MTEDRKLEKIREKNEEVTDLLKHFKEFAVDKFQIGISLQELTDDKRIFSWNIYEDCIFEYDEAYVLNVYGKFFIISQGRLGFNEIPENPLEIFEHFEPHLLIIPLEPAFKITNGWLKNEAERIKTELWLLQNTPREYKKNPWFVHKVDEKLREIFYKPNTAH